MTLIVTMYHYFRRRDMLINKFATLLVLAVCFIAWSAYAWYRHGRHRNDAGYENNWAIFGMALLVLAAILWYSSGYVRGLIN